MIIRVQIQVRGIVQGVGFRPFVYALAQRQRLTGTVFNNELGVLIDVEGSPSSIDELINELRRNSPPLARIESLDVQGQTSLAAYDDFRIGTSSSAGDEFVPLSPDVATCDDCLRELFDPHNRRFRYPFINCTNCGPRFTIIEGVPYDRRLTTMREFAMCDDCRAEYEDPRNRRFHAEPIACAACGPQVRLMHPHSGQAVTSGAIEQTVGLLNDGKIIAIKGIGGFHLACDALNDLAVAELRSRKYREDKPFALMARDLKVVEQFCRVSAIERELLSTAARPIVLLERRPGVQVAEAVAPRVKALGFMLAYAPLHHLLLERFDRPLVMTSANISDEPICYEDDDALRRLEKIADAYLLHDRRIHMRMDDSVVRSEAGDMILRRSRGYAPAPIVTRQEFKQQILACGAELKNTFCLTRGNSAFISHHIGDLENLETLRSFSEGIEHYKRLFHLAPEVVAYDLHPEYLSTKYALGLEAIGARIGVQHHHAHIASCMADNSIEGELLGIAMDGLGFGTDGRMWGGEFFVADFCAAERVGHLEYIPMPGGAKAIREPWRMAAIYLQQAFGDDFTSLELPFVADMDQKAWLTLKSMIATRTNCPETSSMGRLFDAVSSLLRLRDATNYEGQAAIELEQIADPDCREHYEFKVAGDGVIRADEIIRGAVGDLVDGVPAPIISAKFHLSVANLILRMATSMRADRHLNRIALSGGVFQNVFLVKAVRRALLDAGFEVFTHSRVPANDGGISLGQAVIANAKI